MKQDKVNWKPPEGMNQDLLKIFENSRQETMIELQLLKC